MDDEEIEESEKKGVAYLYILFVGMCIISTVFIFTTVPETKGKTPEDFRDNIGPTQSTDQSSAVNPMQSDISVPSNVELPTSGA